MEEARIAAWFLTGLRHEAGRLAKKRQRLREHELLILNKRLDEGATDEIGEVVDTIAATTDTLNEVENEIFIQQTLSLLTPQQQKVIMATVLEGATEQEVADKIGVSKQAVNRIKKRALDRLRKHFRQKDKHRTAF